MASIGSYVYVYNTTTTGAKTVVRTLYGNINGSEVKLQH